MRTILRNGKIYIEKDNFKDAILIEDGIIKEIGTNEQIDKKQADSIIDLEGSTVLPGMNDSHLHLAMTGATMNSCNLAPAKSVEDIVRIGKEYLEDNPNLESLSGRSWNQDNFQIGPKRMINRFDLDKISSDIPIVFTRVCTHMAVGNSKAIEILGVDKNTRISGGVIELDSQGKPNGIFAENAKGLIESAIPEKTDEDIEKDILKAADYAISKGITSVRSTDVDGGNSKRMFKIIHDIHKYKKTKLRYGHQFNFQDIKDFETYLAGEFNSEDYDDKFLSKGALKLFIDGSLGARTALLQEDYADCPGEKGVQVLTDEELDNLCKLASENGIQVLTHAIGDGAVESLIKAYEKTMTNGDNRLRHGIVHCTVTRKDQLERLARLKIPALYQPIFLTSDIDLLDERIGEGLAKTTYAFNSLYKLGGPISMSTDSPIEDCNPWHNIYCAVTNMKLNGQPEGGYNQNEKMHLSDAIDAYSHGSAYVEFKEDIQGRLKPGYMADLVVLDRDIFTIDPMEIKDIQVIKTMIDGEFVYEK